MRAPFQAPNWAPTWVLSLAALIAAAALAPGAIAGEKTVHVAELVNPVAKREKIVAGGDVWVCEQTMCRSLREESRARMRDCRDLAKAVGEVKSFGPEGAALPEDELAQCNLRAKR